MTFKSKSTNSLEAWLSRLYSALFLAGQVSWHLLKRKINLRNTIEQMISVGPQSLIISLVTASFVGMVFTIQIARQFIFFGAQTAVGGVLGIALTRELSPVLTAVIVAGRIGAAFAAEIGTMKVTEQIDALYTLRTDPIDYLVTPRVIACASMLPILTVVSLITGMSGGMLICDQLYNISPTIFLNSVRNFVEVWDLFCCILKSLIFGCLIAIIGCSWGLTTSGGAKGVGQSTTTAVVTALLGIFIVNFFLSWLLFQGTGKGTLG